MNLRSILGNTRRADISFHSDGKIDITSRVANALGMADGDVVDIMTGKGEFYLYVSVRASDTRGRHEAECHPTKRGSRHFRTYCRRLSAAVLAQCGGVQHASFAAGETVEADGHKAVAIITRNIIRHD